MDLFARLVHAEAAGEPLWVGGGGRIGLNRVKIRVTPIRSALIPQVIDGCYQLAGSDGRINLPANESAYRAVRLALLGLDPTGGATGFITLIADDHRAQPPGY